MFEPTCALHFDVQERLEGALAKESKALLLRATERGSWREQGAWEDISILSKDSVSERSIEGILDLHGTGLGDGTFKKGASIE